MTGRESSQAIEREPNQFAVPEDLHKVAGRRWIEAIRRDHKLPSTSERACIELGLGLVLLAAAFLIFVVVTTAIESTAATDRYGNCLKTTPAGECRQVLDR